MIPRSKVSRCSPEMRYNKKKKLEAEIRKSIIELLWTIGEKEVKMRNFTGHVPLVRSTDCVFYCFLRNKFLDFYCPSIPKNTIFTAFHQS